MKKYLAAFAFCITMLSSCLETITNTTINANGSGQLSFSMDMSEAMNMASAGKKGENIVVDTTIHMRDHSDTSSLLTPRQKELLRDMTIKTKIDFRDTKNVLFKISLAAPFKSLKDFNELNELMRKNEYDQVFDKAFKLPMFDDEKKEGEKTDNDNIFGSVVPAFYKCDYKPGSINCQFDSITYSKSVDQLTTMGMSLDGEKEEQMLGAIKFMNIITLPSKPKKIEGDWKPGVTENVLVQKGNLFDIYTNPRKYVYKIQY